MGGAALDECGAGILILERETKFKGLMRGEDSYLGASKKAADWVRLGLSEMLRDQNGGCGLAAMVQRRKWAALAFPARDLRRASAPLLTFYHRCGNPLALAADKGAEARRGFPSQRSLTCGELTAHTSYGHCCLAITLRTFRIAVTETPRALLPPYLPPTRGGFPHRW